MKMRNAVAVALAGTALTSVEARADCAPFLTPGSGATLSGDAECTTFGGTNGENLRTGQNGGPGAFVLTDGVEVTLERNPGVADPVFAGPGAIIGRRPGGVSTGVIEDDARLLIDADGAVAFFQVGRETIADVEITSGGRLELRDGAAAPGSGVTTGESLSVGVDNGVGSLLVNDGSILIDSLSGAFSFIGQEGGRGTLTLTNGSDVTLIDRDVGPAAAGASITIGRDIVPVVAAEFRNPGDGGDGAIVVEDGSTLDVTTLGDGFASVFVGRENGTRGDLTVSGGSSVAVSGADEAGLTIGRDDGAIGSLSLTDGSSVSVTSRDSFAEFGRSGGAIGTGVVSGGSTFSVTGTEDGDILVGAAFADFGREEGGTGLLTVLGEGTLVETTDRVIVGAPAAFGGGVANGTLIVGDGATVRATTVDVGLGGVLGGAGGIIEADVVVDGGVAAPGASPGVMTVDGDFTVLSGMLAFEIAGPDAFDVLEVSGDFIAPNPFTLELSFLDGYRPGDGESFNIFEIAGDASDLDDLLALSLLTVEVEGLPGGFDVALSSQNGVVSALATSVAAVPLPATLPLMLGALGGFAFLRRSRR